MDKVFIPNFIFLAHPVSAGLIIFFCHIYDNKSFSFHRLFIGDRPSTPGEIGSAFLLLLIHKSHKATPIGTAFALSEYHAITSAHNLSTGKKLSFGLAMKIMNGESDIREIIELELKECREPEDWAVLTRKTDTFSHYVSICPESALPGAGTKIGIKDFPVGLFSTTSASELIVVSMFSTVYWYEVPMRKMSKKRKLSTKMDLVNSNQLTPETEKTVVMVLSGRVRGSCGAPYFMKSENLKVFAMHFEAIDDQDENVTLSNPRSHHSYSHGYVLCRLPLFKQWYNENITDIVGETIE
jgi:hypothetical protein